MNTKDLIRMAKSDKMLKSLFMGVFPADILLNVRPYYPSCMIANTDMHQEPGKHWVAFFFTEDGKGEFFDSFGMPPQHYNLDWKKWLESNSYSWTYNRHCVQPILSATCGLHALFYLLHRCTGMTMSKIQRLYTTDAFFNDKMVEEDLEHHTNREIVIDNLEYVINQICLSLYDILYTTNKEIQ